MTFYQNRESGEILIGGAAGPAPEGFAALLPNTTDAAGEKHVPVISAEDGRVEVTVGSVEHPMLPAHYIVWVLLETNRGWQKKDLKPGEKPKAAFLMTEGEEPVAAYEYCNLHGLWKAEA